MKTYIIHTLGCKVNQYETRQIQQWLQNHKLQMVDSDAGADLVIINTCCVTHTAAAKSRQIIRKSHKHNPNAVVIITGCLPAGPNEELKNMPEDVILVPSKEHLPDIFLTILNAKYLKEHRFISKPSNANKIKDKNSLDLSDSSISEKLQPLSSYSGQTRAFLKIQDGCDAYCTYCIVSRIRTKMFNKDESIILDEARSLIDAGHPEIVLTGVFLGAWGRDTARRKNWNPDEHSKLPDLIDKLACLSGLKRLRLSSLEPADVTDPLIQVFQTHSNIAPHLHLPLQAGSTHVLKKMARQYTAEQFLEICQRLTEQLDRPAITTDIIVGFPGETDPDFKKTTEICNLIHFAKIHVFPFSSRRGTPAYQMKPKVSPDIIRKRADIVLELDRQLQKKFRDQFIGQNAHVIIEQTNPPKGRCERYFEVDCSHHPNATALQKGEMVTVKVEPS